MIRSTASRCSISSRSAGPRPQAVPEHVALLQRDAAGHDVVERRHALEQRDVLEGARDALPRGFVGTHAAARLAAKRDDALLRVIEAVDDVQHRGLAGAVRPDDRPDFALLDIERDVADRLHAAEGQRDVVDLEQVAARRDTVVGAQRVPRHVFADMHVHSAASLCAEFTGTSSMSRISTVAVILPLRPSSKVTSVSTYFSVEPS